MASEHIQVLRKMLQSDRGVILPGAPNALAARVVADLGFPAVYLTGAGLTNTLLGLPDLGFLDLSQVTEHTMAIRGVVDLPLVVDADTGFGNALNVSHTVRVLERAGASAVQLEDQRAPKRCGHFDGKELVVADEMVSKIKAAVDSRREDVVVIARTDACAVEGFEAAIERAGRYIDAGADMTFVEAPNSLEELKEIPKRLRAPQLLNIVLGGKTPIVDRKSCEDMGYSFVLYANAALQGMLLGMRTALRTLREKGVLNERDSCIASFAERQRLVGKEKFDEMERSYAHSSIT
jgi:2-methylisocitrate lyase-like PEP mutase family enzyme